MAFPFSFIGIDGNAVQGGVIHAHPLMGQFAQVVSGPLRARYGVPVATHHSTPVHAVSVFTFTLSCQGILHLFSELLGEEAVQQRVCGAVKVHDQQGVRS